MEFSMIFCTLISPILAIIGYKNIKNANIPSVSLPLLNIDCTFAAVSVCLEWNFMSKLFLTSMLLSLVLASCATYKVEGTTSVPMLDGHKVYIKVLQGDTIIDVDSCEVVHGVFRMDGEVDSVVLATLYLGGEGLMPVVIERGVIRISIENSGLKVSGTPLNERLYKFIDEKNELELRLSDISHREMQLILDGTPASEAEQITRSEVEQLTKEMNTLIAGFVTDNFDNPLSAQVFAMYCQSFPRPVITPLIQDIRDKAPTSFKEDVIVKEYLRLAAEH